MAPQSPRLWFPFSLVEVEVALALFGCLVTALTLAGGDRDSVAAAAAAYAVAAYLAGLLVYSRRDSQGFTFVPGGARGGRGYLSLVRAARRSLLLMHVDDDPPVDELLGVYRGLLERGVEQRRLLFIREDAQQGAYDWVEKVGEHANLDQRVVLPEQSDVMRLSFVVIDEETVVISLPGGSALDSQAYSRSLVFRDLLVLRGVLVATAFVEIHRQMWSDATPVEELKKLLNPVTFLAEVRCELKRDD